MAMLFQLWPVCGCLHVTVAGLSCCDRNGADHKAKQIYYVVLPKKGLLMAA